MLTDTNKAGRHNPRPMDGLTDPPEIVGLRLKALRYACGFADGQKRFADSVGIEKRTWNNYERMIRVPSREEAALIRRATGAKLDFIFHGDTAGMAFELVHRIRQAEAAIAAEPPRPTKRRKA